MNSGPPNRLMEAALRYAEDAGWPVFPLKPKGKEPLTRHGFIDATTDPKQIKARWTKWPTANIGLPTGAESGIVVLDVDDPSAVSALSELGATVPTLTSVTASGWHLFFQHPRVYVKSRAKVRPNVDVRGDRGYVVAPPSLHPSGHTYQWDDEHHMGWGTALAPMPPKLLEALAEDTTDTPSSSASGEIITEGERNVRLTEIAGSLASRASAFKEVLDQLRDENERRCRPTLPKSEVQTIAKSIWGRECKQRGRRGKPLPRGPDVVMTVDWSQLPLDTSKDLHDLGYLLDLGRFIAANASMPIPTGKRTSRPAWVGSGRAEIAIAFLRSRWALGDKKIRGMLERWEQQNLVEIYPPLPGKKQRRIGLKGWVQFDRGVGRPYPPNVVTPFDAATHSHGNEIAARTPPATADLSVRNGQQYTNNRRGGSHGKWKRVSPRLDVPMWVKEG